MLSETRTTGKTEQAVHTFSPAKRIKILSVGESGTGKSCLIKRFCESKFIESYIATIGIDYGVKAVQFGGEEVKVNFWDMAGQDEYLQVRNEFYKDTHVALLIFDVNSQSSFHALDRWVEEIERYGGGKVTCVVVGNKGDKTASPLTGGGITQEEGEEAARRFGTKYFFVSAKTGQGITELFEYAFDLALAEV